METSASYEARSAPSSYSTLSGPLVNLKRGGELMMQSAHFANDRRTHALRSRRGGDKDFHRLTAAASACE